MLDIVKPTIFIKKEISTLLTLKACSASTPSGEE